MEQEKYFLGIENTLCFNFKRMTELCAKSKTKTLLTYLMKLENTVQDAACQYAQKQTVDSFTNYESSINWLASLNKEVSGRRQNKKNFLMKYIRKNKYTKLNERVEQHVNYFKSCKTAWQTHHQMKQANQNQQSEQSEYPMGRSNTQRHSSTSHQTSEPPKKRIDLRKIPQRSDSGVSRKTVILHGIAVKELQIRQRAFLVRSVDSDSR
ncbi:hypothetical protein P7H50_06010 [Enterococcus durans]|uniref:hypothetical protein n=1 Tax=Enterococcus durans TaxID=53345 RepID=UPI00288E3BD9|nr:hypothetical protein [Enterococcus durans]MDT2836442.1 hypothetical protein [Enterococcus durans]